MSDLKSCPFCGKAGAQKLESKHSFYCPRCGAKGPGIDPDGKKWNMRAGSKYVPQNDPPAPLKPEPSRLEVMAQVACSLIETGPNQEQLLLIPQSSVEMADALIKAERESRK